MKKLIAGLVILLLLTLALTTYFAVLLQKEKKKYGLFRPILENCPDMKKDQYQIAYIDPKNKCDYIIIKKKGASFDFNMLKDSKGFINHKTRGDKMDFFGTGYLDSAAAVNYIGNYNELYNHDLKNTSCIDFENDKLMMFLIDMTTSSSDIKNLRIYLADYGTAMPDPDRNTCILAVTTSQKEYFLTRGKEVINYGGLCPPPQTYADLQTQGYTLLWRAIEESQKPTRTLLRGASRIVTY
jgi:hypothetical protein